MSRLFLVGCSTELLGHSAGPFPQFLVAKILTSALVRAVASESGAHPPLTGRTCFSVFFVFSKVHEGARSGLEATSLDTSSKVPYSP